MSVWYPEARAVINVILDGYGDPDDDSEILTIPVLPKSLTVHKNSYKQADSWEMVFDANDLPADPDLIRSGSCEIYLFQTNGIKPDQRIVSRQEPITDDPTGFRPRDPIDEIQLELGLPSARDRFLNGNKPLVAGLFDEDSMQLDSSGKWITLSGQDYTAYLAGLQWPPTPAGRARKIPTGRRIDDILSEILAEADPDQRLRLDVRNIEDADLPIVGASETSNNGRGIPVEQDTKYWDVMYKLATRHGLIIFVDGLDVVLSRPQNLESNNLSRVLKFAWGQNIESLQLTRSLGKEQVPTIVVKGYDPKTKKTITVEFPEGKREINTKVAKGDVKKTTSVQRIKAKSAHPKKHGKHVTTVKRKDEYEIIPLYGISDPALLRKAAENLFHLLGRAERRVIMRTKDLKDLEDTNVLQVRAGSAVQIAFDDYNRELLANPDVPLESKVAHLESRGYNETVAQEFAARFVALEALRRPLRVRECTFDYDIDAGISIEMEMVDFVVVDGARDSTDKQTRTEKREERMRHADGSRVGLGSTRAEEQALLKDRR